jgi:hypothetical protein
MNDEPRDSFQTSTTRERVIVYHRLAIRWRFLLGSETASSPSQGSTQHGNRPSLTLRITCCETLSRAVLSKRYATVCLPRPRAQRGVLKA